MTLVGAHNCAAEVSHGDVLVIIADKYFSAPHWDTDLLEVLGEKLNSDAVVWANQTLTYPNGTIDKGHMVHVILTRSYYQKKGYVFHPDYTDWYADNEFHDVAAGEGIIIDARTKLRFRKLQEMDEFENRYVRNGEASRMIYERRRANGFPKEIGV
jgi:hypothetical protein